MGTPYDIRREDPAMYAWSESTEKGEIGYLTHYLLNQGWLDARSRITYLPFGDYEIPALVRVTVGGDSHTAHQSNNVNVTQAFVAMWFDNSMNESYQSGIEQAVWDAGYKPFRIDKKSMSIRLTMKLLPKFAAQDSW